MGWKEWHVVQCCCHECDGVLYATKEGCVADFLCYGVGTTAEMSLERCVAVRCVIADNTM
jgi:hypothetical protein